MTRAERTDLEQRVLAAIVDEPGIRSCVLRERTGIENAPAIATRLAKRGAVERRIVKTYESVPVRWGFGGMVACRRRKAEFFPIENDPASTTKRGSR